MTSTSDTGFKACMMELNKITVACMSLLMMMIVNVIELVCWFILRLLKA